MPYQRWERPYAVEGRWPFPADMLRYETARAATLDDQGLIDKLSAEHLECEERQTHKIRLVKVGRYPPCSERWHSFSWRVVDEGVPRRVSP